MIRRIPAVVAFATLASSVIPTIAVAQHSAGAAPKAALAPAKETSQFDFLIGQFDLTVTPKVSSLVAAIHGAPKLVGTWKGWRALDGFGVLDELRIVDRSGNPSSLTSALRVYDATAHRWVASGVDAYRSRASTSTGEWNGKEMNFSGQTLDAGGKARPTRSRFYDIAPDGFKFQQDRANDDGKTWDEGVVKIVAKRVSASAQR